MNGSRWHIVQLKWATAQHKQLVSTPLAGNASQAFQASSTRNKSYLLERLFSRSAMTTVM
jgi:hypothetical protein